MPPPPPLPPDTVPTTTRASHVLRPHHVLLLWILMAGLHPLDENPMPQKFTLSLHRILLDEIAEVKPPRSYWDILGDLKKACLSMHKGPARELVHALGMLPQSFQTPEDLSNFMQTLPILFLDRDDEESARYCRRSLFGYFCRRCFVTFSKLSLAGVARLHKDFLEWLKFKADPRFVTPPGYAPIRKDLITNDYQIFKTKYDKREYATAETYALFMKGVITGDSNVANEGLRRFFEQRFHEGSDSGLRQHAMLNLARMYYLRREMVACRKTLEEAITTSRTAGDNATLQHCSSLLHRLPVLPTERGKKPIINEIQPQMHPLEILHDTKKLLVVEHQQPLTAAYEKLMQAIGLYDHYIDVQGGLFMEHEQYAQHAVQSIIWSFFGCSKLARIEEDIVISLTEYGSEDNTRLTVTLNRAYDKARQGNYVAAVAGLLEPDVWRGLSIADYNLWAGEIWHILALRASRRGQTRQLREYLIPRRPDTEYAPRDYQWAKEHPIGSLIRDPLHDVLIMRRVDHAHTSLDQLLTALWHAEYQGRYALYRTAVVMLADVGLEFGMTKWSRRILDEVMPQIMSENDLEQKGFALFTLARCVIAAGNSSRTLTPCIPLQPNLDHSRLTHTAEALREATHYLEEAERCFIALDMFTAQMDVQFLLSVVHHNLGEPRQRDEVAQRHEQTRVKREEVHACVVEEWIEDTWSLVADVGIAIASRRAG
ncbi:hypothetical protein BV20DRAFT_986672 [Pilatotrama ljubarskyi]|nr:hypothetical protein BV20DRAFT_986672 [Pilatotrama ljubarskyi]